MDAAGIGEFLGSPAWQGVGVLVTIATGLGALYLRIGLKRRAHRAKARRGRSIKYFDPSETGEIDRFYDEFCRTVGRAEDQIYRSGSGFFTADREGYFRRLLHAEEQALARGVEITRVQTGHRALGLWADGLADLMERFPEQLRVFADFDRRAALDFGLVDPYGPEPLACLYLEEPEATAHGVRNRTRAIVFFYNHRSLAEALAKRFMARVQDLSRMTSTEVRGLAKPQFFFAYGPHMLARHMRQCAPDSIRHGPATLRGWQLMVGNTPLPRSVSVRIERTGNPEDRVDGVVYELSEWEKRRLLSLERGRHSEVSVNVANGARRFDAFAIIHDVDDPTDPMAQPADLLLMIEGAEENEYTRLAERLHRLRGRVVPQRLPDREQARHE